MKNLRQLFLLTAFLYVTTGCATVDQYYRVVTPDDPEYTSRLCANRLTIEVLDILYRDYYKEINYEDCARAILRGGVTACADCFTRLISKERRLDFLEPEPKSTEDVRPSVRVENASPKGPPPPELLPQKYITVFPKAITREIGYVRMTAFNATTPREFKTAVDELMARGGRVVIVDLRHNTGGLVDALCEIVYFFEPNPLKPVFYTSRRSEVHWPYMHFITPERASQLGPRGRYQDLKVVVLTDRNTISCGEIMAAWFKYEFGATVVGEVTYGKGVIQRCHLLSDGSRLFVPYWEYFVGPRMVKIHGIGVMPNIFVNGEDAQMKRAIRIAKQLLND